jgi:hypothetical protein
MMDTHVLAWIHESGDLGGKVSLFVHRSSCQPLFSDEAFYTGILVLEVEWKNPRTVQRQSPGQISRSHPFLFWSKYIYILRYTYLQTMGTRDIHTYRTISPPIA